MNQVKSLLVAVVVTTVAAGCSPGEDTSPDSETVVHAVGQAVVGSGGLIATLSAPMEAALQDSRVAAAGDARARLEAAISRSVIEVGCVSLSWSLSTATVHFDDCHIPDTDQLLDGSISVRVRIVDPAVVVTLDHLTLGARDFHGSVTARARGTLSAPELGIDAELTLAGASATVAVSGLAVHASVDGVTVSGGGAVTAPDVDATVTVSQLHWSRGDCLPSSGSVALVDGNLRGVITFLATTPATGVVRLRIEPLPATTVAMFPPCGSGT